MNLHAIEYFVAVAKELNFSTAANRLYVSQPAVSKQIQNLEAELGYKLFNRSRPNLTLTDEGADILKRAEQIVTLAQSMVQSNPDQANWVTGPLRIGYSGNLDYEVLFLCVEQMVAIHPQCKLYFSKDNMSVLHENLKKEQYDVIFAPLTGLDDNDEVEVVTAALTPLVLAVSNAHPLAGRKSVSLAELSQERFITFLRRESRPHSDMLVIDCKKAGFSPIIGAEVLDVQTYLLLIAANQGIATAGGNLRQLAPCGISFIPIDEYANFKIHIGAAWLRRNRNPARLAFSKILLRRALINT